MTGNSSYSDGSRPPSGARRWPELLVGVLVLALVGGGASLLLGERTKPEKTVEKTAQVVPSAIPASPGTPGEVQESSESKTTPAKAEAGTIPPAPTPPPVAKIPPPVLPEPKPIAQPETVKSSQAASAVPQTSAAQVPAQTQTPAQTSQTTQSPATQTSATQTPATQTPVPQTAAQTPAPTTASVPQRAGGAVVPSAQRTPLRSDYRIMLGSFGDRASLQSATAAVSALGYTVYAIDLGSQYVAQVGPYADEATGQQALADIQRVYGRAALYAPRGRTLENQQSAQTQAETPASEQTPVQQAPAAQPATVQEQAQPVEAQPAQTETPATQAAAEPAPTPEPAPAPSGPTYLQVGAFNNPEGAQRFVEQLRGQGFNPSVNAPPGGKVTVVLGPFTGNSLLSAESRLEAAGLEHFRLR